VKQGRLGGNFHLSHSSRFVEVFCAGGAVFIGNEGSHGIHRSYTSRRCAMRVTLISFAGSSMIYTTRQSPTRTRH